MAPTDTIHEKVYDELIIEFTMNTKLPLHQDSYTELQAFLAKAFYPLIDDRLIEWDGKAKRFALSCAAGLARVSEKIAKSYHSEVISKDILREALRGVEGKPGLIVCWERVCPLPPVDEGPGIFIGCLRLREHLDMPGG